MKLALANGGLYTNFGNSESEPYFDAFDSIGFGFTYFEVSAGLIPINMTFTIYTSGATSIMSSSNSKCGNVSTSATYGTYFQCTCALPAFIPPIIGASGSQGGQPPQGG